MKRASNYTAINCRSPVILLVAGLHDYIYKHHYIIRCMLIVGIMFPND